MYFFVKVSDYRMAVNLVADIVNGPTQSNNLPPFQWTSEYKQSHVGLPNVYNFPFIQTMPLPSPEDSAYKGDHSRSKMLYFVDNY